NAPRPALQRGIATLPRFGVLPASPPIALPPDECLLMLAGAGATIPWCQGTLAAGGPTGEWIVVVSAAKKLATQPAVDVLFLSVRGDTIASVRVEAPRLAVHSAEAARYLRAEAMSRRLMSADEQLLRNAVARDPQHPI